MDPLYQENILDHYKHPHNRGFMEGADVVQKGHNASCGDDLVIYLKLEHEAHCSRTASSPTAVLPHRTETYDSAHSSSDSSHHAEHSVSESCCNFNVVDISFEGFGCAISQSGASMLTDKVKGMIKSDIEKLPIEVMYELYGVEIGPQREKCAMLAIRTLHEAVTKK